jgi:hypothetical protein
MPKAQRKQSASGAKNRKRPIPAAPPETPPSEPVIDAEITVFEKAGGVLTKCIALRRARQ